MSTVPDYQPPLTRWSHLWRALLMAVISGLAWWQLAAWQWRHDRGWLALDIGLGVAAFLVVSRRRRYPMAAAVLANVMGAVSGASAGPAVLSIVSVATRRRWREIIPISILSTASGLVFEAVDPATTDPWALTVPFIIVITAVAVGWGMYIGSRRELLSTLRWRAEAAESEQAARVSQARTAERGRIAREMHDVLAHRISLVTMHAGALTYRDDLTPEQMRETARIIQDGSHQALVELREVLGVLRDDPGDAAPERPQPSAADIPALLDEARGSGMNVDSTVALADGVPDLIGRATYRIVQEALTNARKHAPDTLVEVRVTGEPESGISLSVSNPLRVGARASTPDSGLGLLGLTERAALAGGRLRHHVTPDRRFVLSAWLPWQA